MKTEAACAAEATIFEPPTFTDSSPIFEASGTAEARWYTMSISLRASLTLDSSRMSSLIKEEGAASSWGSKRSRPRVGTPFEVRIFIR